jgi:hypothetical protein
MTMSTEPVSISRMRSMQSPSMSQQLSVLMSFSTLAKNRDVFTTMTDIDRILGRTPSVRESSSLIPTNATEIPGTEGADDPGIQQQPSARLDTQDDGLLSTGLALVAPDTTPQSSYPLNPAQVPAGQPPQPAAPLAQPGQTPAQSYFPRPAPVASDSALNDPALAAIVGESIRSVTESAVPAGIKVSNAMSQGNEMPAPVEADPKKVCEAFRRFNK